MCERETIRQELEAWLDDNWDPNRPLRAWREMLVDANWAAVSWPTEWHGRGYSEQHSELVRTIFEERNIVGAAQSGPRLLIAETLFAHGSDDQKRRFLKPALTGEHTWCQLFSEPGSGSDLAGATTKAVKEGGTWVLNGQKVWTTSAHHADFGFILARTNWDVPKHEGLSYFLMDMRQPGVEVRPLKQMNGHASFNEVFITDAEVPHENLVAEEGNGWRVAMTTLTIERRGFAQIGAATRGKNKSALQGSIHEEYQKELETELEPYKWYPQRTGRVDLVLQRAIETGRISDPILRQEIAKLLSLKRSLDTAVRMARAAETTGAFAPIGKLAISNIARQAAKVHAAISEDGVIKSGVDGELDGVISEILVSVPAISIAGGTDEIQRNIIAERILNLPKEPRFDTGPFRDVPRN